jgi:hypothetical protein
LESGASACKGRPVSNANNAMTVRRSIIG